MQRFIWIYLIFFPWMLTAHPWGGLEVDEQGKIHFAFTNPILGDAHYASIWYVVQQDSIASGLTSKQSPSDFVIARLPNRQLVAAERYGSEPNHTSRTWMKREETTWTQQLIGTDTRSFVVQAFLPMDEFTILFAKENQLFQQDHLGVITPVLAEETFERIDDLAWGPNQSIYVLEKSSLSKIDREGNYQKLATNLRVEDPEYLPFCGANILFDLAVDEGGNVFIAYFGNRQVLKVNPQGDKTVFYQSDGPWAPHGIDERNGELYILESSIAPGVNDIIPRIRKVDANGTAITLYNHPNSTDAERQHLANQQEAIYSWIFCGVVIAGILIYTKFGR
ncbi:MAG: hypothetical protein ACPGJS_23100 [Flammeovirgaceae bacterium]